MSAQPHTFIQWKGTDVCMDFHCPCGHHSHFDTDFAYFVVCAGCGLVYELGTEVSARRLSRAEANEVGERVKHDNTQDEEFE